MAKKQRERFPQTYLGRMEHCLVCEGDGLVIREAPPAATVKDKLTVRKKKLPAWLKNASAAVRRDYLRERGEI